MSIGAVILLVFVLTTLGALLGGVVLMGRGGAANARYGNKMMIARVSLQGLALATLLVMFALGAR